MDTSKRFEKGNGGCPSIQCETNQDVLCQSCASGVVTAAHRVAQRAAEPCLFGKGGTCCRNCNMGPCQIIEGVDQMIGVCGADAATVAARNFARIVAGGSSAHMDHGRGMALAFLATARGETPYEIKDAAKLRATAQRLGIDPADKATTDLAIEVGTLLVNQFGQQEGGLALMKRAPKARQEVWAKLGVAPRGIDREVVELMHRTHMGVDQDAANLLFQAARCALADGWGASMIATELSDVMFGTPVPIRTKVNIGVLKEDEVNVTVHGHEPVVAEALAMAANDPEIVAEAKKVGAKGVNLAGVCCTGNEILMRRGLPIAGSFVQQEVVLATGAVEAMVVDVQCIMQGVSPAAGQFHTRLVTTSEKAKIPGARHIAFDEHRALDSAKEILRQAIAAYPERGKHYIPVHQMDVVAGFSHETITYMLGGRFRGSYKPLNDNIANGRIRGVAAIVGCDNYRVLEEVHIELAKELIANDVLVLVTGCAATGMGRAGLLTPEALSMAGDGLKEVLEAVGCPPVLHMGSCVDNSRILIAATEMVLTGGLGNDISDLPAVGCAPQWMSEKAVAIGQYFVSSGASVIFGPSFPTTGSKVVTDYCFREMENLYGAHWDVAQTSNEFANKMLDHINAKRKALGLDKKKERVLFDMAMRRELQTGLQDVGCHGPGA
ncbi:anaerobic carbon-monoxide dehydrogenase catalytic subunit [Dissulfurirhabdus thermomarina]|uniref:Carbon monoxide dehydrogenase n=1 Tax=Dissulfurirhabdus thermomarina TaxID=1765737 RepID=A0A6N9TQ13_DISTH|nr:anaerobic carbon-monoxide dehydrogenase catalytic subunit [Dissulfurirhabdus thermomarina]NDY42530.1 anaerobic carbon-monoxide dehydrogenase catalytic subunit [Dissulfurirhabdus thermomarina]NMX23519.1 anaerobic carbon-monoxide dehydrogenase catalytic subunit [Dissulfurirhabdus thermomarina]